MDNSPIKQNVDLVGFIYENIPYISDDMLFKLFNILRDECKRRCPNDVLYDSTGAIISSNIDIHN
jgi:hypothetical protein